METRDAETTDDGRDVAALRRRQIKGVAGLVVVIALIGVVMAFGTDRVVDRLRGIGGTETRTDRNAAPSTTTPTTTVAVAPPVPAGVTCRPLAERAVPYPYAVAYWLRNGRPRGVDPDKNGIPCDSSYDDADVAPFFARADGIDGAATCADLLGAGAAYPDAVAYWLRHGKSDRLDADGNGTPCDEAYPPDAVAAFLHFDGT